MGNAFNSGFGIFHCGCNEERRLRGSDPEGVESGVLFQIVGARALTLLDHDITIANIGPRKYVKELEREILLSFWKVHILHHAGEQPLHGQWMIVELRRHGYEISPGTLYPLLHRMERLGWLR